MGGMWRRGLGHLPRKKIIFVPKMSVHVDAVFNRQNHGYCVKYTDFTVQS